LKKKNELKNFTFPEFLIFADKNDGIVSTIFQIFAESRPGLQGAH
jgi:hypothetical protein